MSTLQRARIGLFHQPPEQPKVVVGRNVAVDDFVQAVQRHGAACEYALFCHGTDVARAAKQISAAHVSLRNRHELSAIDTLGITAWHEPQFDTFAPFAVRARASAPFPVTILHHTVSYKELLHESILRLLLAKPHAYDAILCTSTAARTALQRLVAHVSDRFAEDHGARLAYRGRYELVPLAVDVERYAPGDWAAARARFKLENDAFVLLWIGRLSAIDKADLLPLVRAFGDLQAKNPGRTLRLVCAGTEHPGDRFGALLSEYAKHLGLSASVRVMTDGATFMPWKEQLYRAADVFVAPTDNIQETYGLTPVEAMACGVPQIVSDWNGYRDTVVDGETGFLVPTIWADGVSDVEALGNLSQSPWDHLALAQSVVVDMKALVDRTQRLIDQPALAAKMSAASRTRALENYAWDAIVARYERLWAELSEEARRAPEAPRDFASYAQPAYMDAFGHYASRRLGGETALRLTELGRELIAGSATVPSRYLERWRHLEPALLQRVIGGLAHASEKGTSLTLDRIGAVLSKGDPLARATAIRHVLFLMKYGFVEEAD